MGPEAVDLREVPEAVAEFQLNAPAQLQLVKAELVPALRPSALGCQMAHVVKVAYVLGPC